MKLTLFGTVHEVPDHSSAGDLLKAVSPEDLKKYYAVRLPDGRLADLFAPLDADGEITPLPFADEDGR